MYNLNLYFTQSDTIGNESTTLTIDESEIIKDSVKLSLQRLSGLHPSSNTVELSILSSSASIERIIRAESDVRAILTKGDSTLFTGFLSYSFSWSVTNSGKKALSVTLEDIGTRVMGTPFLLSGSHLLKKVSVSEALSVLLRKVSVIPNPHNTNIETKGTMVIKEGETVGDIIKEILYETGYAYYFDNYGRFTLYRIETSVDESLPLLSSSDIIGGVTLQKSPKQYQNIRVEYTELKEAENYLVYSNNTSRDTLHPYCYFSIPPLSTFDGKEIFLTSNEENRTETLVEAVNAGCESERIGGKEIVALSSPRIVVNSDSSSVVASVEEKGKYLKINVKNLDRVEHYITCLEVYAECFYSDALSVIRLDGENSGNGNILNEEMVFIHDKESVESHAKRLSSFYRYSRLVYTLKSTMDLEVGSRVHLVEDTHSSLDTYCLIYRKESTDRGVYSYSMYGLSDAAFVGNTTSYRKMGSNALIKGVKGEKGEKGERGEDGKEGQTFTLSLTSETYLRDLRREGEQAPIGVEIDISGYDGEVITETDGGELRGSSLVVPYQNSVDNISLRATLDGKVLNKKLSVIDITKYSIYHGTLETEPEGITLDGDFYFSLPSRIIKVKEKGEWVNLERANITRDEYSRILSVCESDVLSTPEEGSVESSYYGYFNTLIAHIISASHITTDLLNVTNRLKIENLDGNGITFTPSSIEAGDDSKYWRIDNEGNATFLNAEIRGTLTATSVEHSALITQAEIRGKSIGSVNQVVDFAPLEMWNISEGIERMKSYVLLSGYNYTGGRINGKALKSVTFGLPTLYSENTLDVSVPLSANVDTHYYGSALIKAKENTDAYSINRLTNNYSFPLWIRAEGKLEGFSNSMVIQLFDGDNNTIEWRESSSVCEATFFLESGESVSFSGHSSASWGEKTMETDVYTSFSPGLTETEVINFVSPEVEDYINTTESSPEERYEYLGRVDFSYPTRYLFMDRGLSTKGLFGAKLSNVFESFFYYKDGEYIALRELSHNLNSAMVDLGGEENSLEVYLKYKKNQNGSESDGYTYSYSFDHYPFEYSSHTYKVHCYRSIETAALKIIDTEDKSYTYQREKNNAACFSSDSLTSVLSFSSLECQTKRRSGDRAYNAILTELGITEGKYKLATTSSVQINNEALSSLSYMEVFSDRIVFSSVQATLSFYRSALDLRTGEYGTYNTLRGYLEILSQREAVVTKNIIPMEGDRYSLGESDNRFTIFAKNVDSTGGITSSSTITGQDVVARGALTVNGGSVRVNGNGNNSTIFIDGTTGNITAEGSDDNHGIIRAHKVWGAVFN